MVFVRVCVCIYVDTLFIFTFHQLSTFFDLVLVSITQHDVDP